MLNVFGLCLGRTPFRAALPGPMSPFRWPRAFILSLAGSAGGGGGGAGGERSVPCSLFPFILEIVL